VGWKLPTLAALLWAVALGVWGAVAAGSIGGPLRALVGSVLTVLAGVVTAYIPSIRDEARRRASDRGKAREALRRASELPREGPAGLLDPRRGLVGFVGRERELAALIAWCEDGPLHRLRLVTEAGGVGKTRLSVELCARMEARGWRCVRIGDQGEGPALKAMRQEWLGEVLLVVDYAETRSGLPDLLRVVALDGGVVRVLLLARSVGEWWDRLRSGEPEIRDLLSGAGGDEPLSVAVSGELSNVDLVLSAVPVFAVALGVAAPPRVSVEVGSGAVRVLDLHAAALVAVLRSAGREMPVSVSVSDVLDELLGHEERFWQGTAERLSLLSGAGGMKVGTLRQIVAAGALLGAASQAQTLELLARVPDAVESAKVASWLRDMYPPEAESYASGGTEWLGALCPDRLAEHLVVAQLTASQELAARCLTNLDQRQALRAMTLLGRVAADQQTNAGELLARVLPLLELVVAELPADAGLLTAISDAIPYPSAALAEADLAVTQRILQILPTDDLALRARWLNWLSTTLAQTGRLTEALSVAREAVKMRREMAAANLDRYRADLADSLSNLGVRFSELGRPAEALPVTQEAVDIYRELAAGSSGRYRAVLAGSLTNLGNWFSELGRPAEALLVTQEAVKIRRELAAAYPDRYRADLATAMSNLSVRFFELGRLAEALRVTHEAVEIRRELAAAYPDRYRADMADSLSNLGKWFFELGRPAEALPVTQEAVEIRRELAAAYPDRYRPDLAAALTNLGVWFSELGRTAEAVPVTQEAVEMYRELADANPGRYRADLADSLTNLSGWFAE
jgi:tetratricopeptide (TPR) repeat protein